ncbi:MAG: hypothetical protein Q9186_007210 [Xanthomendoza sp. 1 TL-2023]
MTLAPTSSQASPAIPADNPAHPPTNSTDNTPTITTTTNPTPNQPPKKPSTSKTKLGAALGASTASILIAILIYIHCLRTRRKREWKLKKPIQISNPIIQMQPQMLDARAPQRVYRKAELSEEGARRPVMELAARRTVELLR